MTELSRQEPSNKMQDEKSAWGPLAKPPYSGVDVTKLSAEEQAQARAKINSYIESVKRRMIQDRHMKNKQEELGRKRATDIQQDNQSHTQDTQPSSIQSYTSHNGDQSYDHGSSRKANTRYTPYHPYSRPTPRFSNNSVTFSHNDQQPTKIKALCSTFTMTGTCYHNGCHLKYSHDPYKVTVCKDWLYNGGCALGSACPLSHSSSHHSTPTCTHFQKGRCTNDTCRFAHIRVNPNAQNCVAFGQLGYCEKGNNCAEIHSYECPYFANGNCRFGDKCRMPHRHNASRMRQQDRPPSESCSQASSHKDTDSPKIHVSDMLETREILGETASDRENHHIFTQQNDFVPLDS